METNEIITEDPKTLKKSDLVSSVIIFILGLLFTIGALVMPVTELTDSMERWYAAPGVFPAIIGILIMVMGISLYIKAKRAGIAMSFKHDFQQAGDYLKTTEFKRFSIALGLLVFYIFVLLGNVRYELSTFIYLFCNMMIFKDKKGTARSIIKIIIICAVASVAVAYGFSNFAQIPLP